MNRKEADIFENIFISRRIFEQIEPDMDALDILQSYEDLTLPDALDKLAHRLARNLEHRERGRENKELIS